MDGLLTGEELLGDIKGAGASTDGVEVDKLSSAPTSFGLSE